MRSGKWAMCVLLAASMVLTVMPVWAGESSTPARVPQTKVESAIETLLRSTERNNGSQNAQGTSGVDRVRYILQHGHLHSISAPRDKRFRVTEAMPADPVATAMAFLAEHKVAFGFDSDQIRFSKLRLRTSRKRHHVRLQQTYSGLPVFAGEVVVQLDQTGGVGNVLSDALADTTAFDAGLLPIEPAVLSEDAKKVAVDATAQEHASIELNASDPTLVIFDPSIVGSTGDIALAWRITVTSKRDYAVADSVLVNAHSGSTLLRYPLITPALQRRVYNANNTSADPGTLIRSEGQQPLGDTDADTAYAAFGDVYNFYYTRHGRDSLV